MYPTVAPVYHGELGSPARTVSQDGDNGDQDEDEDEDEYQDEYQDEDEYQGKDEDRDEDKEEHQDEVEDKGEDKDEDMGDQDEDNEHVCRWEHCDQTFSSDVELTNHLTSDHVSYRDLLDCLWGDCSRRGDNPMAHRTLLIVHLRTHTGYLPFKCRFCVKRFSAGGNRQVHQRQHIGKRSSVCVHPGCGKTFTKKAALETHENIHTGVRPFKCEYCDETFSDHSARRDHVRRHRDILPYACSQPECDKGFLNPSQFKQHEKSGHNRVKKY